MTKDRITVWVGVQFYNLGIWCLVQAARWFQSSDRATYEELTNLRFSHYVAETYEGSLVRDIVKSATKYD